MDIKTKEYLEQCAEEDYWEYRDKNPKASEGEAALEAFLIYRACLLPPPKWAIDEVCRCWNFYKHGADPLVTCCVDKDGYPNFFGGSAPPSKTVDSRLVVDEDARKKMKHHLGVKHCKTLDEAFGVKRSGSPKKMTFENKILGPAVFDRLKFLKKQGYILKKSPVDGDDLSRNAYVKVGDELSKKYGKAIGPEMVHNIRREYERATGKKLIKEISEDK